MSLIMDGASTYADLKSRWLHALAHERTRLEVNRGRPMARTTNIYAIGIHGEYVKIGLADNILRRLASLQVGNPEELSALGSIHGPAGLERFIHNLLAEDRLSGEWFAWTEEVSALVDVMAEISREQA